jgi:hypothetical protein
MQRRQKEELYKHMFSSSYTRCSLREAKEEKIMKSSTDAVREVPEVRVGLLDIDVRRQKTRSQRVQTKYVLF